MSFESLTESLGQLGDKFGDLHKQMEDLNDVNDSLIRFNKAFGAFLTGMQATSTSLNWPEAPVKSSFQLVQQPALSASTKIPRFQQRVQKQSTSGTKFLVKINPGVIIQHLPLKFREQTEHTRNMQNVIKVLARHPDGVNMPTMAKETKLPKYKVTECLNALLHSKDVIKQSQKHQLSLYRLEPSRYPTTS